MGVGISGDGCMRAQLDRCGCALRRAAGWVFPVRAPLGLLPLWMAVSEQEGGRGDVCAGARSGRTFHRDVLAGIADNIPHAAAALGEGSEILGFDTERSTDHGWGPRAQIFVRADAVESLRARIDARLPETFQGWPVRYYRWQTGRVEHHVGVTTVGEWLTSHLGFDPRVSLTVGAWLGSPQQILLEVTGGTVFRDDSGELTRIREMLAWYPHDLWLWMMASQWQRLQDDESLIGRTADVGDDLGSRLVAARIAQGAVRLCFLQERRYAPYAKWLGSAFARLDAATEVGPLLHGVLAAADFASREHALVRLYETLARRHNALGVTAPLSTATGAFAVGIGGAVRPFRVLNADRFVQACLASIGDEHLRRLPVVGSIDQITAPTDLLIHFTDWPRQLGALYERQLRSGSEVSGHSPPLA